MVFSFEHLGVDRDPRGVRKGKWQRKAWKLSELKQMISRWQDDLHERAWNSVYLSNHDLPRPVSRFGDDCRYRDESAKMLAALLHSQAPRRGRSAPTSTPACCRRRNAGSTSTA